MYHIRKKGEGRNCARLSVHEIIKIPVQNKWQRRERTAIFLTNLGTLRFVKLIQLYKPSKENNPKKANLWCSNGFIRCCLYDVNKQNYSNFLMMMSLLLLSMYKKVAKMRSEYINEKLLTTAKMISFILICRHSWLKI